MVLLFTNLFSRNTMCGQVESPAGPGEGGHTAVMAACPVLKAQVTLPVQKEDGAVHFAGTDVDVLEKGDIAVVAPIEATDPESDAIHTVELTSFALAAPASANGRRR